MTCILNLLEPACRTVHAKAPRPDPCERGDCLLAAAASGVLMINGVPAVAPAPGPRSYDEGGFTIIVEDIANP